MNDFKRREFIKLSALGFANIALQLNSISLYAQSANAHLGKWNKDTLLNWDAFLERITQLAKTQHQSHWNQKLYAEQVKQLLLQCNFPEFENVKKGLNDFTNNTKNWIEASGLHKEVDFQVSLFQFDKGEYIPHHDHPDMTGVINVVSGSLLTKNYSIEEQLPTTREVIKKGRKEVLQKCVIREVENEIIKGGDVSILTAHEGNIHSIMPNELTQLVDVFTPAYSPDTNANWYEVNEDGFYKGRKNVFEAEYITKGLSEVHTIKLSSEVLNRYVGSYRINDKNFLKIFRRDKEVILEPTRSLDAPGRKMRLLPYEQNKFWVEGENTRCVFNIDNEKAPQNLTLYTIPGPGVTAKKIEY
ncbi:cupin domain-containing protein [Spongiimicrobium salis]|uniref:hypothetical protein n=1 Tax=Spongiimicrobium salis TaxID=1667022 RepID=UPI00374D3985